MQPSPRPAPLALLLATVCACGTGAGPDAGAGSSEAASTGGGASTTDASHAGAIDSPPAAMPAAAPQGPAAPPATTPSPPDPGAVVATVNGTEITAAAVDAEARKLLTMQTGGRMPPAQMEAIAPSLHPAALQGLVDGMLLDAAAHEAGIEVSEDDMRREVELNLESFLIQSNQTREDLAEKVAAQGTGDLDELLAQQATDPEPRRRMGHARLVRARFPEATAVTDEDVAEKYEAEKDTLFARPEMVRASHILVEEREQAEELDTLAKTADVAFADLAREHSTCPSAPAGGDLGFFPRQGPMVEPFAAAAFELEPGQISDVVETQFGFHVIQVTERKPADVVPFERAAPILRNSLELERVQPKLTELLEELRAGAEIEYADGMAPPEAAAEGDDHTGHDHADHEGHDHAPDEDC